MQNLKHKLVLIIIIPFFCFIIQSCIENATEVINVDGTWAKVKSGITEGLYDIDFVDSQNGWIVGDSGLILHSFNGGESWEHQTCSTKEIIGAVDFVDDKIGWICNRHSILKTTNGGKNWEIVFSEDFGEGYFRDIQFLDENIGFAVGGRESFGSKGVLIKTEDGGETWQQASLNSLPTLTHISIVDEQNLWICGFGGTILSSEDKGLTWEKKNLNVSPFPSLTTIQFVDKYNGWTSSRDDYLGFYMTTDGGKEWSRISETSFMVIGGVLSFSFIDENIGWICNFPFDRTLKTTDGGKSWVYDSDIFQRINSFVFLQNRHGWAVGSNGGILHYLISE